MLCGSFPKGVGLKKVHRDFNGRRTTNIEVVSLDEYHIDPKALTPTKADQPDQAAALQDPGAGRLQAAKHLFAAREEEQALAGKLRQQTALVERKLQELKNLCPAPLARWAALSQPPEGYESVKSISASVGVGTRAQELVTSAAS